ncbi:MAG: bifunctional riboflavin kinase/FAD synthetase [bacterium]|nr:bifunctional riboflavin kinase/FAD synthetase [bacterium]
MHGSPLGWCLPSSVSGLALSIGVFDGVHRGHQILLSQLMIDAAKSGLTPAVATFDPHPLEVLAPQRAPKMLTSIEHRLQILEELGMGVVGVMPFPKIRKMQAEQFTTEVLLGRLKAKLVVVGENFQFGRGGAGSPETLRRVGMQQGFGVKVVDLLTKRSVHDRGEIPITSSRIRRCVAEGYTAQAARLLGRPFELRGTVIEGDRRGRELGIPTANLDIPSRMSLPANGIYAAWAEVDAQAHRAALNVGVRPTFGEGRLIVEAHLLDFSGDLYGREMRLRFIGDRIRPEIAYGSVDELLAQVDKDIVEVRRLLGAGG